MGWRREDELEMSSPRPFLECVDSKIDMDVVMHNVERWYRSVQTVRFIKQACNYGNREAVTSSRRTGYPASLIRVVTPVFVWVAVVYLSLGRAVS